MANEQCRYVSTAAQRTQHGALYHSVSTSASTAPRIIVTWVSTFPSSDLRTSTVRQAHTANGTRKEGMLTRNSLAVGSAANHESWRKRECDQVLPVTRRFCCARQQGSQSQIHKQCGDQVQGRATKAMHRGRQAVRLESAPNWYQR